MVLASPTTRQCYQLVKIGELSGDWFLSSLFNAHMVTDADDVTEAIYGQVEVVLRDTSFSELCSAGKKNTLGCSMHAQSGPSGHKPRPPT